MSSERDHVSLADLIREVQGLDVPSAHELHVYEAHVDEAIAHVDRTVLTHPRATELLGWNSAEIVTVNHRIHAGYMAEIFRAGTLEDLPATAVWAYRASISQGVHPDYWTVHVPEWEVAFTSLGLGTDTRRIRAVYRWLVDHHADLLELSREPPATPTFTSALSTTFAERLVALDLPGTLAILGELLEAGIPVESILTDMIDPALQLVGARWEGGEITTAHEHRATAIANRLMGRVAARIEPGPGRGRTALVASAESEHHGLGALSLDLMFEAAGWEVTHLGANVLNRDVVEMAAEFQPQVIAISVSIPGHLPAVRRLLVSLRAVTDARIIVGGGLFTRMPTLARTVDADLVTADPVQALRWAT